MKPLDRPRLRQLIASPTVDPALAARLAAAPADPLIDLVLDPGEPWWRRRACARALAGHIPDERAAALVDLVCDPTATAELRATLLELLAIPGPEAPRLLAWLRQQDLQKQPYGLDVAILAARGALADLSALPQLCALAADPWHHRWPVGERALDALLTAYGEAIVLAGLGVASLFALAHEHADPAARLFGVRLLHRASHDLVSALADPATFVAHAACELLVATEGDDDALWQLVDRRDPGHLWALVVLARRGHPIAAVWAWLGSPRIELPGVPADVRAAIVRAYVPGQRDTDPRWLLEASCVEAPPQPDEDEQLRRAAAALMGLGPQPPVSAADYHEQGHGTYHVITTNSGAVTLSTLGPFFTCSADDPRARTLLELAGFRHIDDALAGTVFAGLSVYFFGNRGPLRIWDLLFYWQD